MLIFDEAAHTYTLDGTHLPSVTEITRFLAFDYKSDKPWLAEQAARRGTAVHEACALIDYGETPEETPETAGYLTAYRRFLRDYRPDWTLIEHPMGSRSLGFAGTLDRYGSMDGQPVVLDLKTGSLHNAALAAQLTAYARLLASGDSAAPCPCLYGLKLSGDGTYLLREVPPRPELVNACMVLHRAAERKKGNE